MHMNRIYVYALPVRSISFHPSQAKCALQGRSFTWCRIGGKEGGAVLGSNPGSVRNGQVHTAISCLWDPAVSIVLYFFLGFKLTELWFTEIL